MDIIEILRSRYSTKKFDPTKKISEEDMNKVKAILQLAPSSTNIQPWRFIIASSEAGKKKIAESTKGIYAFNEGKVLDASAVVVFSVKSDLTKEYLDQVIGQEDYDGRYSDQEVKNKVYGGREMFANMHQYDYKDLQHWFEKQVYLNLGNFLLAVAHLGIDAVPMEGFDKKKIDENFKLREEGFTSSIIVAIGYRSETDFNAKVPKSRLQFETILREV